MDVLNNVKAVNKNCDGIWDFASGKNNMISYDRKQNLILFGRYPNKLEEGAIDWLGENDLMTEDNLAGIMFPWLNKNNINYERIKSLAKWRNDKIVYRFSDNILVELLEQAENLTVDYKVLPSEVLEFLPFDCFAIELPGFARINKDITGYIIEAKRNFNKELKQIKITPITKEIDNKELNKELALYLLELRLVVKENLLENIQDFIDEVEKIKDDIKQEKLIDNEKLVKSEQYKEKAKKMEESSEQIIEYTIRLTELIFTLCLYLSSSNADIKTEYKKPAQRKTKPQQNKKKTKDTIKEVDKYQVGYNYVNADRVKYINHINKNATSKKAPHMRRGFFKTQHFGKGNKKLKTIWIMPVMVNAELLEDENKKIKVNIID